MRWATDTTTGKPSRPGSDPCFCFVPAPTTALALMRVMAFVGFFVDFWAWALISPLGPMLKETLHLSSFQQALAVAVPVLVGSLGRIPVGALTDRLGARLMFPAVSAAT